jgi:aspartokinase-like uncharacterized kinase
MNPSDDTEWNDALRRHGILPPKAPGELEVTEDALTSMIEESIKAKVVRSEHVDGLSKCHSSSPCVRFRRARAQKT